VAQPTQLVYTENPGGLPAAYVLPPGLDLVVQSIVARIDGTSASGTFVPTLSIYSQSGNLMARVRPDQEFAAGDTGVVTWAPFLRRRKAATRPLYFQAYGTLGGGDTMTTLLSSGGGSSGAPAKFSHWRSNAPGSFELYSNGVITTVAPFDTVYYLEPAVAIVSGAVTFPFVAGGYSKYAWVNGGGGGGSDEAFNPFMIDIDGAPSERENYSRTATVVTDAYFGAQIYCLQGSGVNRTLVANQLSICVLPGSPLPVTVGP
jgi:hypothetical protein